MHESHFPLLKNVMHSTLCDVLSKKFLRAIVSSLPAEGRAIWALKETTLGKDNLHFEENAALSLESLCCVGWVCQMYG